MTKERTIALPLCLTYLIFTSSILPSLSLPSAIARANVLLDVRLDTILRNADTPKYAELRKIGITHLGTSVGMKNLNDLVIAMRLTQWNREVHANGFLTYASVGGPDLVALAQKSFAIGFDEIELDEMLSTDQLSALGLLSFVKSVRQLKPTTWITVTEYSWSSIQSALKYLTGIPNVRIASDEYNHLSLITDLSKFSMHLFRVAAWTMIIRDPTTNWDSYNHVLKWITTIKSLGLDLFLFTIDPSGAWKVKWKEIVFVLMHPQDLSTSSTSETVWTLLAIQTSTSLTHKSEDKKIRIGLHESQAGVAI